MAETPKGAQGGSPNDPPSGTGGSHDSPFVRAIVKDPANVPDVMQLYGYGGASSEEGHDRLYLSPDLSAYVEVPRAAILHATPDGSVQ